MGDIKKTAIIYAGYEYQTLFGVKKLLEWNENPNLYIQIALEADTNDENIAPAIDDVVCKRYDGLYEYYQVKFTADSDEYSLSWEWLFKKTKKGRSLVHKLFDGLSKIDLNKTYCAELVTNRVPDSAFAQTLTGNQLDVSKLSDDVKSRLVKELGSEEQVRVFAENLHFMHSKKDIEHLKIELLADAFKIGASESIHHLMDEARTWAIKKDHPSQAGWIFLTDIRDILSVAKPKPIPQNFAVPQEYTPPSDEFHASLLETIKQSKEQLIVVSGPPGRGKSTYLSYLITQLDQINIPFIRHHYFLSVDDRTGERFSHFKVQNELKRQLSDFHGVVADNLLEGLKTCANGYASRGKPLVVLIDGLDHVWRDNYQDKRPLDSLFSELLPPIDNVIYLIGTQPVEDSKLPITLLREKKREDWIELPTLSGNAILHLIKKQAESKRLELEFSEERLHENAIESAEVIYKLTNGHPLSVIYLIEQLIGNKKLFNPSELRKLPKQFGNHIYDYYRELWHSISYAQQCAIHIICEFNLGWEKTHLNTLIDETSEVDIVAGIQHLLYRSRTGYKPFHQSLIAYVVEQTEHGSIISKFLPKIKKWIDSDANDYIRNVWSIRCNLKEKKLEEIKTNLTRSWVIERLSEGYFVEEVEELLESAVSHFAKSADMPEAHRLRTIKTRVANVSYNNNDFDRLSSLTLTRAPKAVIEQHIASHEQLPPDELAILSSCLLHRGCRKDAEFLNKHAKDSYNASYKLRTQQSDNSHQITEIFRSEILLDYGIGENLKKFGKAYFSDVIKACVEHSDLDRLFEYHGIFDSYSDKVEAEVNAFRLTICEGIDTSVVLIKESFEQSEFLSFARRVEQPICSAAIQIHNHQESTEINSNSSDFKEELFTTLNALLNTEGNCCWLKSRLIIDRDYSFKENSPKDIFDAIFIAAMEVRERIVNNRQFSFSGLLDAIYHCELNYKEHWEERTVSTFLHEMVIAALDCHLLLNQKPLDATELSYLINSDLYRKERFFHWYVEQKLRLLTSDSAQILTTSILQSIHEFNIQERISFFIAAAELAFTHENFTEADKFIAKAWDLTVGYGSYKDHSVNELIKSFEFLAEVDPDSAVSCLQKLTPFVVNFSTLTTEGTAPDDDISRLISKYSPLTLVSKYKFDLSNGEASYANNTLNSFFEEGDLSSKATENLCKTGLLNENLRALESSEKGRSKRARELMDIALQHNGSIKVMQNEERYSSSRVEKIILDEKDFTRYPPEKFMAFVDDFKRQILYEKHYLAWFNFWVEKGNHNDLLAHVTPLAMSGEHYETNYILDALFDLSLKYKGKRKSFDLLVAAHNQRNGWSSFFEIDTSYARLRKVASIYPERADEFVEKTTIKNQVGELTLPYHRYTYLLCQLGRKLEAFAFVNCLTDQMLEETTSLQAKDPEWEWGECNSDELVIGLLISRLKIPLASVKWWVAQQLVYLLKQKQFGKLVEEKLLIALEASETELDCIEILSIFYFASQLGYRVVCDLSKYIKARSICSDMILQNLGLDFDLGNKAFDSSKFTYYPRKLLHEAFDTENGRSFPAIYVSSLSRLDEVSAIPLPVTLEEVMRNEWCHMQYEGTNFDSYLSYYINTDGHDTEKTASVFPISGKRARSAYLRALDFARSQYHMPKTVYETEANLAFPFDSCLFLLKPAAKLHLDKYDWSEDKDSLLENLKLLINSLESESDEDELGAVSFSIAPDEFVQIDIEIVRASREAPESNYYKNPPWVWRNQQSHFSPYKELETESVKSCFLAARSYPFQHFGHWHSEVETRGLYSPVSQNESLIVMNNEDGNLFFTCNEQRVATFNYSNHAWQPSYNRQAKPHTISLLKFESINRAIWSTPTDNEVFVVRAEILKKQDTFAKSESETYEFAIPMN